ncbi:usher protein, partial [Salmonella enterica subsp. enterica serovar Kentucky]|nr:usher protein [Salmonella enterica subsp. enterica serovar Kentucky]
FDSVAQDAAEKAVVEGIPALKKQRKLSDLETAMVVVDRFSGDKIIHGLKPVTGIPNGQCLELRSADSQVRYSAENQRLTFIIP